MTAADAPLTADERAQLETWERDGAYACNHRGDTCPTPIECREKFGLFAAVESILAARLDALHAEKIEGSHNNPDTWALRIANGDHAPAYKLTVLVDAVTAARAERDALRDTLQRRLSEAGERRE